MKLSVTPLELVLKGGEGSPGLFLAPVRCSCQTWLLGAPFQQQVPETGLACRMGAWESGAQLPSDSHRAFPICFCGAVHGARRHQVMETWALSQGRPGTVRQKLLWQIWTELGQEGK